MRAAGGIKLGSGGHCPMQEKKKNSVVTFQTSVLQTCATFFLSHSEFLTKLLIMHEINTNIAIKLSHLCHYECSMQQKEMVTPVQDVAIQPQGTR